MKVRWAICLLLSMGCSDRVAIFRADALDGGRAEDGGESPDAPQEGGSSDARVDATAEDAGPTLALLSVAAFGHTCAAGDEGLYCWGRNRDGQLGSVMGDGEPSAVPLLVSSQRYRQVCAGEQHSCALRATGSLECWGHNERGQLGVGDTVPRAQPTPIEGLSFQAVACGGRMTCGITSQQQLLCWGENAEGALGQGDAFGSPDLLAPSPISVPGAFRQVSVGQGHACAVAEGGELYCWGRNAGGQVGLLGGAVQVRTPGRVDEGARYLRVAAGQSHSCGVRSDGALLCWGSESEGQLGLGLPEGERSDVPRQVEGTGYSDVQANWFHTCALRGSRLFCWGRNLEGQLGIGNTMGLGREAPAELVGASFTAFTTGQFHTCALRDDGVFCWGKNDADRELGIGGEGRRDVPTRVVFP